MAAGPYERVDYHPAPDDPNVTSVVLGDVRLLAGRAEEFLSGVEVGNDGDTKWYEHGTVERRHLIAVDAIVKRTPFRLNPQQGRLVLADRRNSRARVS